MYICIYIYVYRYIYVCPMGSHDLPSCAAVCYPSLCLGPIAGRPGRFDPGRDRYDTLAPSCSDWYASRAVLMFKGPGWLGLGFRV